MVKIDVTYQGNLRCAAIHSPSGAQVITDAPVDNMGKGESFSPTDLVATALGTCLLTVMGIMADRLKINIGAATASVIKEMVTAPVRRIGKLSVTIHVPTKLTAEEKQKLQNAAMTCPVHQSLHPDVEIPVIFNWA